MADLGVLAKSALGELRGYLCSGALRQNVLEWLHFKPRKLALFLGGFPLVLALQNLKKLADLGVLVKSALAQLRVHLWTCALGENVLQEMHFKPILIYRQRYLRRGVLGVPKVGLFSRRFSLGPPLAKFQKMADLGVLAKSALAQLRVRFWSRGLR